jgi:GNAT superfamily N-acetyltransferase
MNLSKREVSQADEISDELLRAQFLTEDSKTRESFERRHLVACDGSKEVGLVSLILWREPKDLLEVPRIFVVPNRRRQGIGQWLFEQAEDFGRNHGRKRIQIEPLAQDGLSTEQLLCWCAKNNYRLKGRVIMERDL